MNQPNSLAIDGLKSAFEAIESTRKKLISEIETQAPIIYDMRTKKQKLLSDPISLDDYSNYLKTAISQCATTFESEWLATRKPNGKGHNQVAYSEFEARAVSLLSGMFGKGFAMSELCFFFPEMVHERLMASLRKRPWGNEDKPNVAARREILKTLDVEIKQLEQQQTDLESQLHQINQALSQ